jgi:hypothetical protein
MGADRGQHTEQSTAEVSKKLSAEFGIDYKDLYEIWNEYNHLKVEFASKTLAIDLLEMKGLESYLICFALETINKQILDNLK